MYRNTSRKKTLSQCNQSLKVKIKDAVGRTKCDDGCVAAVLPLWDPSPPRPNFSNMFSETKMVLVSVLSFHLVTHVLHIRVDRIPSFSPLLRDMLLLWVSEPPPPSPLASRCLFLQDFLPGKKNTIYYSAYKLFSNIN